MKKTTLPLIGHTFGNLKILSFSRYFGNYTFWNCKCSCGNEIEVNQRELFSGEIQNCGCTPPKLTLYLDELVLKPRKNNKSGVVGVFRDKNASSWKTSVSYKGTNYVIATYDNFEQAIYARLKAKEVIDYIKKEDLKNNPPPQKLSKKPSQDLVGQKFGKLTVISLAKMDDHALWKCKCECGNEKTVYQHNLLSGTTNSCGCGRIPNGKKYYENNIHTYKGIQIEKAIAKTTQKNNTTGFRGVMLDKKTGKYRTRMILQGVRYELGYYSNFEEAKKARLVAEEKRDAIVEEYMKETKRN